MTRTEVAPLLHRYAEAKNHQDVDTVLSLCADDCSYENVALGAAIQGKPAMRDFYLALFDALPDYAGEFDGTAYGPDSAVVWGRFGGTLSGRFMGIAVYAGRRIEVPVTFVCQFRDGLLVTDRGYFDAATLAEQMGVPLDAIRPTAPPGGPGDLRLEVTEHAETGELTVISWRAAATVNGRRLDWTGIDRFQVRDGRAIEALIAYDTLPLRDAVKRVQNAGARRALTSIH